LVDEGEEKENKFSAGLESPDRMDQTLGQKMKKICLEAKHELDRLKRRETKERTIMQPVLRSRRGSARKSRRNSARNSSDGSVKRLMERSNSKINFENAQMSALGCQRPEKPERRKRNQRQQRPESRATTLDNSGLVEEKQSKQERKPYLNPRVKSLFAKRQASRNASENSREEVTQVT
jgi:hypothetical protein